MFIHEHYTVSIAIEHDADISFGFAHFLLQRDDIFRFQRIRLVVRERAVQRVE